MSRTLRATDGATHIVVAPTTTTKMASRMLAASAVVAARMPTGFYANPALDILLTLHIAEEDARYLAVTDLNPAGSASPSITSRWIVALISEGLIDRRGDLLALSSDGHAFITDMTQGVFDAQRSLD